MGICCSLYALSPEQLARLRADPPLIWRLLEPDDASTYLAEIAPPQRASWLQRLLGRAQTPAAPAVAVPDFPGHERLEADLDKSWDGLRHCIGRCAPDAPDFFAGDGPIGRIEVGYGPALAVDSDTLARYAALLEGVGEEGLRRQLQSSDFKDVYLGDLWRRQGADVEDYLLENFRELLGFLRQAAAQGQAAVICYT